MTEQHKILLITTGGTIAGKVATDKGGDQDLQKAEDFSELIRPTVSFLEKQWGVDVDIDPYELCEVDSSDILPQHWEDIAAKIKEKYDDYNSFIISHGTNTLGYTCAALSFALANLNKPVILTGSQVPSNMPGTDAAINLNNAVRVAAWPREKNPMKGVMAVFGSHIITGTRVKKETEFDYDAFTSFGTGCIGRIGRIINIHEANLEEHLGYLHSNIYPEARTSGDLICENDFHMKIASLTEFPGMSPDIFKSLVEKNGVKGFIFRAFGAGDASTNLHPALEFLKDQEIPVVITTQAPNGNSNFQVNEPGHHLRDHKLAIPAYDMSIEAQTTKLAWLLAKKIKGELTYDQLCKQMVNNIRGEINVMWEVGL